MRSNGQASKSGKQEWRELGRRVGIEYRRNHETHEKHEMKEVIGLYFSFSHPRDFVTFAFFVVLPPLLRLHHLGEHTRPVVRVPLQNQGSLQVYLTAWLWPQIPVTQTIASLLSSYLSSNPQSLLSSQEWAAKPAPKAVSQRLRAGVFKASCRATITLGLLMFP